MLFFEALPAALLVILGVAALVAGLWVAPRVTLSRFRRAVQAVAAGAAFFAVAGGASLFRAFGVSGRAVATVGGIAEVVAVLCLGVAVCVLYGSWRGEISELLRLASVDELTDLANRSYFLRAAERRFALFQQHGLPLSCLVLDIDDFKQYNDHYGHEAGDEALRCVGRVLREKCRGDDLVARYGGEEFMVLMNGGSESAIVTAERIRVAIEIGCSPEHSHQLRRQLTVSIGAYTLNRDTATLQDLISRADGEMYQAKRAGKNRVSVAA